MRNTIIEGVIFSLVISTIAIGLLKIGVDSVDRCHKAGGSVRYCANI